MSLFGCGAAGGRDAGEPMMKRRRVAIGVGLFAGAAGVVLALAACTRTLILNQTKERTGNITVVFVNNTDADASFSFGTWNAWDRSPGAIDFQQNTVPAHTVSDAATLTCERNAAIGTDDLVERVLATSAADTDTFDPEAFDSVVHFSRAEGTSSAGELPTEGTALGLEVLLGIDYSCEDQIIFTFNADPDAPGGFRIDFEVIQDTLPNP